MARNEQDCAHKSHKGNKVSPITLW